MTAKDQDATARHDVDADSGATGLAVPGGLPTTAGLRRVMVPPGRAFDLLIVPTEGEPADSGDWIERARLWTAAPGLLPKQPAAHTAVPVLIPLYGCHVIWAPARGAVLGPTGRLDQLQVSLLEFAGCEADLADLELRCNRLLAATEGDAAAAFEFDERGPDRRAELASRFQEAVAVRRGLAALGPAVHVPPVHPPTLASQLAERLRDRTRLPERHELVTDRADFVLQIYEACGQRASEAAIARRQMGLEWAIIVILVAQLALMIVELLASRNST